MALDLSFKNKLIGNYFNGDDSYVPVSELIYVHEHPLVRNTFMHELERMINQVAEKMTDRNMQGPVVTKFVEATMKIGAELPTVNKQTAPILLAELRTVYKLCKGLLN